MAPATSSVDVFILVADRLHAYCEQSKTIADIAAAFHLENAQVKSWLARAVDEGLLRKLNKPVRYTGHQADTFHA